jgi:hypothetical protein
MSRRRYAGATLFILGRDFLTTYLTKRHGGKSIATGIQAALVSGSPALWVLVVLSKMVARISVGYKSRRRSIFFSIGEWVENKRAMPMSRLTIRGRRPTVDRNTAGKSLDV